MSDLWGKSRVVLDLPRNSIAIMATHANRLVDVRYDPENPHEDEP